ncbi:MAG: nucleotidyl transferase AbiEii/AbiGii toxin family protein [Natronospirillum sp.]|uniref:nucleotidyl transferase AbiEii/AbiGii toxin family protein n=1 Tax=Natronospirillum sp. TaxID=2812955 RepID=UPI0025DC3EAE|nr:nucleotidyl transferase AbiEii/AbiGii toxin family protein [Natronospirillum sp.]MCH8552914.1 nucleotidyl transferase AbiEii/AbiGii toxin family protein [Natronospirillum sp.]
MAESYLELPESDQKDILQAAAAELGRQAAVLEKDIWVCWTLQTLFSMPDAHPMAFKGGTSLSKVYNAIDRFSEDVDITLDYRHFEADFDPFAEGISNTKIRKFSNRLKDYVKDYANDTVIPLLRAKLDKLPTAGHHTIKIDQSGEKIWVSFPSVTEEADEYLKSHVLIELGGRNVIDPNERHTISPYVATMTAELDYPTSEVVVLSPERTFWEKATLIHVECNRGQLKENADRLSRHWYDLVMLSRHASGQAAVRNRDLFEDVVCHKKVFFKASHANYDACLVSHLQLLPGEETLDELRADYEKMIGAGMMYQTPPTFDEIVESIRMLEQDINTW